ncbi:MAG: dUTP diphosphatase [Myxococcales bacterium]|nr:dUTP diphosphatase [Myxococcales bacterium]MDP3505963.1 dUTP diphosphatase [Myxococcales bacterium]
MNDAVTVNVRRVRANADLELPRYQSELAAGMDLRADLDADLVLKPLERSLVATGLSLEIPPGFEGQVRPRSGLAAKQGLTVLNAPGTIDADYRGEVKVLLVNLSSESVTLKRGDRIAQLVVAAVTRARLVEVGTLSETARGSAGFGSTGVGGTQTVAEASLLR